MTRLRPHRLFQELALAIALLGLWAFLGTGTASAVSFPPNTFGAAPTARFLNARPPATLGPLVVSNTTRSRYVVRLKAVVLDQRLDGAFEPRLSASALRSAKRLLGLSATRFALAPGQQQVVGVRWLRRPRGSRSAALAVLVEGRQSAGLRGESGVGARAVILNLNFVQLSGSLGGRGGLVALRAQQAEKRQLALLSRIRNTSRELGRARAGRVVVRDAAGRVVFRRRWGGQKLDLVVAGASVDFPVRIAKQLPAGRYRARSSVRFGNRRSSRTTSFTLVGTNQLPTVKLRIGSVDATGSAASPAHVRVRVNNIGTAAAPVEAAVALVKLGTNGAERSVAERRLRGRAVKPGAATILEGDLGRLAPGRYRVDVALDGGGDDRQTGSTQVLADNGFSTSDRVGRFFTDHPTRTVGLVALLVIAGLLVALLRTRRLVRL